MAEIGRKYTILGLIQCMNEGVGKAPSFIEFYGRKYRYEREEHDYVDIDRVDHYLSCDIASMIENMRDIFFEEVTVISNPGPKLDALEKHTLMGLLSTVLEYRSDISIYDARDVFVVKNVATALETKNIYLRLVLIEENSNKPLISMCLEKNDPYKRFECFEPGVYYNAMELLVEDDNE